MTRQTKGKRFRTLHRFETIETGRLLAGEMTNPNNPLDVNAKRNSAIEFETTVTLLNVQSLIDAALLTNDD